MIVASVYATHKTRNESTNLGSVRAVVSLIFLVSQGLRVGPRLDMVVPAVGYEGAYFGCCFVGGGGGRSISGSDSLKESPVADSYKSLR